MILLCAEHTHISTRQRMIVTLAFDSFKGSLTSEEVADAFQEGLLSALPHCNQQTLLGPHQILFAVLVLLNI